MSTKVVTIQLDTADYECLAANARQVGLSPDALAQAYVRAELGRHEDAVEMERRRQAGIAALAGLAELRKRLPDAGPVDVVELIREGRRELDRRTAG